MTKRQNETVKPTFFEGPSKQGSLGFTLLYSVKSILKNDCKKITKKDSLNSSPSDVVVPHLSPSI